MKSGSQGNSWIFGNAPAPHASRSLFCFPHAGGGASLYRAWVTALAPDIDVYPVQLPGRENRWRERPYQNIDELINILVQALDPYFAKPFAFFGHSMGALISFALTRYLREQGLPLPTHLFLSAYRAPHTPAGESLHQLSDDDLIAVVRQLNRMQSVILEIPEMIQLLLPILRADFAACETYIYTHQEPLDLPFTVFGGKQDPRVGQDALAAWRTQTSNTFAMHMLSGDHFFWRDYPQPVWQIIARSFGAQSFPARP